MWVLLEEVRIAGSVCWQNSKSADTRNRELMQGSRRGQSR